MSITSSPARVRARTLALALAVPLVLPFAFSSSPASAAGAPAGAFAQSSGIIVDLTALTAIALPGPLAGSPIDPNTFSNSSQSCPPESPKAAEDLFPGNVNASPAATAKTLNTSARAQCATPTGVAVAQTEGVTALVNAGVPTITADVIRAQANSDCTSAPNAKGTVIQNLKIAGQAIPDALALNDPNQRIDIPGVATVIVNEQHPTADGRGIVVNGLHVIGASPALAGDLIISHAVSGVVCPNGKGKDFTGVTGAKPEFTFTKSASPSTAKPGDTVTYTATVNNVSPSVCDVRRFVDHLDPAFDIVSTDGGFGKAFLTPAPKRGNGGSEVIIDPTGVSIAAGKSVTQTFVVKLKDTVKPGTYYNNLELFCATAGDFASGPLAPVTVPGPTPAPTPTKAPKPPVKAAPGGHPLAYTGTDERLPIAGLLLLATAVGVLRLRRA